MNLKSCRKNDDFQNFSSLSSIGFTVFLGFGMYLFLLVKVDNSDISPIAIIYVFLQDYTEDKVTLINMSYFTFATRKRCFVATEGTD